MHDVAIIGAGPYGLSIAAHLARRQSDFRIFGKPMHTWRTRMPQGMHLKSEGFASNLYDPGGDFPLSRYCADHGIAYADTGRPVPLDVFTDYGLAFQQHFVPTLENKQVTSLARSGNGFALALDDGTQAQFRRVIMAIGITYFAHTASELANLPPALLSHSSSHREFSCFAGRSVVVVGGGASAADCAALLSDAGARVAIVTRRSKLAFHARPRPRTWLERAAKPMTTIGPGWRSVMCTRAPLLFHAMPERFRLDVVRRFLGPAPCWFVRDTIEASVAVHTGVRIAGVRVQAGKAVLDLCGQDGARRLEADHVLAATGYRVDLARLRFIDDSLAQDIACAGNAPILSRSLESSVKGLFFTGASAAPSFGPVSRFACGARFTARRLAAAC